MMGSMEPRFGDMKQRAVQQIANCNNNTTTNNNNNTNNQRSLPIMGIILI